MHSRKYGQFMNVVIYKAICIFWIYDGLRSVYQTTSSFAVLIIICDCVPTNINHVDTYYTSYTKLHKVIF